MSVRNLLFRVSQRVTEVKAEQLVTVLELLTSRQGDAEHLSEEDQSLLKELAHKLEELSDNWTELGIEGLLARCQPPLA